MNEIANWWHRLRHPLRYVADCSSYERFGHVRMHALAASDLGSCVDFAGRLRPEDIRSRFGRLASLNDRETFRRLFGIDDGKTRTIGLFASRKELLAVGTIAPVRPAAAEIALIVRSDVQRRGLGATLMANIIKQARCSGFRLLSGYIDPANVPMRRLARRFGFEMAGSSEASLDAQLLIETQR